MSASESIVMTFTGMDAISSVSFHLQAYEYYGQKNCEVFMITDKDKWRLANRRTFRKFPEQKISINIKLKGNNQDIDVILYDIDTLLLLRKLINKFR